MSVPRVYKADAIILKRRNFGETDRILTVFTKQYGKLRLIAKGIRRVTSRRAPHLEVFTRVNVLIYRGASLDSLSEVMPVEIYKNIRTDLGRVSIAYLYCELIDALLPEKQEHRDIFDLFVNSLHTLNGKNASDTYQNSRQFALELLWRLGFLPRSKTLKGDTLKSFIESITEKRLNTPHFARHIASW